MSSFSTSGAVRTSGRAQFENLEGRRLLAAGSVKWALPIGAEQDAMTTDLQGNAYVVGRFTGTVDFNPSRRVYAMTAQSPTGDMFIAKYGNKGEFLWGLRFGDAAGAPVAADAETARSINFTMNTLRNTAKLPLDPTGSTLWVAGTFSGSLDFDPHPRRIATVRATGGTDMFLLGVDQDGVLRAATHLQDLNNETAVVISTHTIHGPGYIEVIGSQDDGSGDTGLIEGMYDATGKLHQIGGLSGGGGVSVIPTGTAVDRDGFRWVTGTVTGNYTVASAYTIVDLVGPTSFVLKFDELGQVRWGAQIDNATITGIVTDEASKTSPNGFAIMGTFTGSPNFQLDGLGQPARLHSAGGLDAFVARYNTDGRIRWGYRAGGTLDDAPLTLHMDGSGGVYMGGQFQGTATFGRGRTLVSEGGLDGFMVKYGANGRVLYQTQVGGAGDDAVANVAIGQGGDVLIAGPLTAPGLYDVLERRQTLAPFSGNPEDMYLVRLD
ncbi:MAG TPA: hypothetical protein VEA69_25650 [Tepidisphaeraceae bacterium]|nr:hypothetical protein [Tepidisphaeraceae bacterium]